MSDQLTLTQLREELIRIGDAAASALSGAATQYRTRVEDAIRSNTLTETKRLELFADSFGTKLNELARNIETWSVAAREAGERGVGSIMENYADNFRQKATNLMDQTIAAQTRIDNLVADANHTISSIDDRFSRAVGPVARAAGPIVDAAEMLNGAFEWGVNGNSAKFGQACMGVVLSATVGAVFGGLAFLAGAPIAAVVTVAALGYGLGSYFGDPAFNWLYENSELAMEWFMQTSVGQLFNESMRWVPPRRDPLVFDLDADGVETTGLSLSNPILFDTDADGIRSGTGWIRPDDGFLVMDRNGNGVIDNGRELFGDATLLPDGTTAADGFAALAPEDSNGNGVVNASDSRWSSLRIWRDLNQDGSSQANELFTLSALGITGINLGATAVNQDLGNGNVLHLRGTYTRSDGSTGATGTVEEVSNLNLGEDRFNRRFTDVIPIRADVADLPDMRASGAVRDLQEAVSLGGSAADSLRTQLRSMSAGSRSMQLAGIDSLVQKWAATAGMPSMAQRLASISTQFNAYQLDWARIGNSTKPTSPRPPSDNSPANVTAWQTWDAVVARTSSVINVLEAFNGRHFYDFEGLGSGQNNGARGVRLLATPLLGNTVSTITITLEQGQLELLEQSYKHLQSSVYGAIATQTRLAHYLDSVIVNLTDTGITLDASALKAAVGTLRASDPKAALFDVLDLALFCKLSLDDTDWDTWKTFGEIYLPFAADSSVRDGLAFYTELVSGSVVRGAASDSIMGSSGVDYLSLGEGDNLIFAGAGGDTATTGAGKDRLFGDGGDDSLQSGAGNDLLAGGIGNDTLAGESGNDTYLFAKGWGADVIAESGSDLTDVIQFTDVASTEVSFERRADNLVLKRGTSGDQITLNNFYGYYYYYPSIYAPAQVEQFRFTDTTLDANAVMSRAVTYGTSGADNLTAYYAPTGQSGFLGDGNDGYQGSQFADTINLEAGDDYVSAYGGNDTLDGGLGNDTLYGNDGNDTLRGADGADTIGAGTGNDTVTGGTGNDTISDEGGTDTYLFAKGWGADVIAESGSDLTDVIQFTDVASTEVSFERRADNLVLKRGTSGDQITLNNFYGYYYYYPSIYAPAQVEQFRFTDTTLDANAVMSRAVTYGTSGADNLTAYYAPTGQSGFLGDGNDGYQGSQFADTINLEAGDDYVSAYGGNDTLDGGLGNDTLYGNDGNDTLRGADGADTIGAGTGNDTVTGGTGNDTISDEGGTDTYLFAKGWGADVIAESGSDLTDVIQFTDVASTEVSFERRADNLVLKRGTSGDQITLNNFYGYYYYYPSIYAPAQVEQFRFTDTTLDANAVMSRAVTYGTSGADNLTAYYAPTGQSGFLGDGNDGYQGSQFADTINLEAGDDYVSAYGGNDTLDGGLGNDTLYGNDGNDTLRGADGADTIGAGTGNDTVTGGTGNDTISDEGGTDTYLFAKGWGADVIAESGSDLTDVIQFTDVASTEVSFERRADNLVLKRGTSGDQITLNNFYGYYYYYPSIYAPAQVEQFRFTDTTLDANAVMSRAVTYGTSGADNLTAYYAPTGQSGFLGDGNDGYQGSQFADTINLEAGDDYVSAYGGNDTLDGGLGNDTLYGNDGNDTLIGGIGSDALYGDVGFDSISYVGSTAAVTINLALSTASGGAAQGDTFSGIEGVIGSSFADSLTGDANANRLDGGAGGDTMVGGLGDDVYVVNSATDVVTEAATAGTDRVESSVTYTLGAHVESLTLTGTSAINATGNTLANVLTGNAGNNRLDGSTGADAMVGGAGNDTYVVDNAGDVVTEVAAAGTDTVESSIAYTLGAEVENLTLTGTSAINGTGNALNNVLIGNGAANTLTGGAGNDTLNGGTGADSLVGGLGNDTFVVDNGSDVTTELVGEGTDAVQSAITWTLGTNVENLTLTGASAINGTGNTLDNVLTGNAAANLLSGGVGNDTLNGGAGLDTLLGGIGNDIYVVDVVGDIVTELTAEGTDTVHSAITWTLATNVDNLTLTGTAATNGTGNVDNNTLTGNTSTNVLTGGAGNDSLNGGAGADTLIGGVGNDTYTVDNAADVTTELVGEGTDLVNASLTWTLAANIENLTLTGTTVINGTGNTLDNALTGNSANNVLTGGVGNDTLSGGAGADALVGGLGDDIYVVDVTGDVITEVAGEGTDSVQSSVTYVLGATLENLTLTGTTAINGTGNTLNNVLTGNAAANTLTGGAGNDTLSGGAGADALVGGLGDDIYVVDAAGDVITEVAGEGTDSVQSSVAYVLSTTLENLTLIGTAAINGTGNTLNNIVTGNSAANVLTGGAGNDTLTDSGGANVLIGGAGNDTLNVTSAGIDRIAVARGHSSDLVYSSGTAANDVLEVSNGITKSVMGLIKTGNDLVVDLGASETIALKNWYATTTVRNIGTLKIIGDVSWVPGQAGAPTQVETLNMALLVSAFDAWRVANPTLTRWGLESFASGASMLTTAPISDEDDEFVGPLNTPTAPDAYVPSNLKSLMKFYERDTALGASDWVSGAPRTVAAPVISDEPVTEWARIQPVARTAPWWEQSDITALLSRFNATSNLGQAVSWQQMHSELALQLGHQDRDNDGAPLLSKAVDWETPLIDNYWAKALADDTPRLVGSLSQKMR